MSKVIDLLNAAKTATKSSSNYALAKATGIPEPAICAIYKGKRGPTEEHLARLALILERPIGEVLAEVRAEDSRSEKSREFWRDFLSATRVAGRIGMPVIWSVSWLLASIAGAVDWHSMYIM